MQNRTYTIRDLLWEQGKEELDFLRSELEQWGEAWAIVGTNLDQTEKFTEVCEAEDELRAVVDQLDQEPERLEKLRRRVRRISGALSQTVTVPVSEKKRKTRPLRRDEAVNGIVTAVEELRGIGPSVPDPTLRRRLGRILNRIRQVEAMARKVVFPSMFPRRG